MFHLKEKVPKWSSGQVKCFLEILVGKFPLNYEKFWLESRKGKQKETVSKNTSFSPNIVYLNTEKKFYKTVLKNFLDNVQTLSQKSWKTSSRNENNFVSSGIKKILQNVPFYTNRADLTTESKLLSLKIENYFRCYNICTKCESSVEKTLWRNCILSKKTSIILTVKKLEEGQKICHCWSVVLPELTISYFQPKNSKRGKSFSRDLRFLVFTSQLQVFQEENWKQRRISKFIVNCHAKKVTCPRMPLTLNDFSIRNNIWFFL